jgi:hypothetical protein
MPKLLDILRETFRDPLHTTSLPDPAAERAAAGALTKSHQPSDTREAVSRNFKLIFFSVLALSILTIVGQLWIVMTQPTLTAAAADLVAYLRTTATAGVGAILGLLGGKAT